MRTESSLRRSMILISCLFAPSVKSADAQCEINERQKLIAANGRPVAPVVSSRGDILVAGDPGRDCPSGPECGSAYVFRRSGANWVQEAELIPSDLAAYDHFGGGDVAADGDRIVVGAVHDDPDTIDRIGAAYVFRFDGSTWVEEARLSATDPDHIPSFGSSVAVLGDRVFVGAPTYYDAGPGAVYVFGTQGSAWALETMLLPPEGCLDDTFGRSISVHGERALVGGPGNLCGANVASPPGAAYVFRREGTNWLLEARLPYPPGGSFVLGASVSLFDDVALVSHLLNDHESAASIYRRSGTMWTHETVLGPFAGGSFIMSVATDGVAAVISVINTPPAYVFLYDGGTWSQVAQLAASDGGSVYGVSLSGNRFVLGDDVAGVVVRPAPRLQRQRRGRRLRHRLRSLDGSRRQRLPRRMLRPGGFAPRPERRRRQEPLSQHGDRQSRAPDCPSREAQLSQPSRPPGRVRSPGLFFL